MSDTNETRDQVNVVFGAKFEQYDLDDGIKTVGDAIEKFDENPNDVTFTVSGRKVNADSELRAGDTILILTKSTAAGGMKGATL